jgi:hypothetical protein
MRGFGLPRDDVDTPGIGTVFVLEIWRVGNRRRWYRFVSRETRPRRYCKRCKQILDILHNRDRNQVPIFLINLS